MKTKLTKGSNHWSLISLKVNGLNSLIKRHRLTDWIQKQNPFFFYKKHNSISKTDIVSEKRVGKKYSNQIDLRNKWV